MRGCTRTPVESFTGAHPARRRGPAGWVRRIPLPVCAHVAREALRNPATHSRRLQGGLPRNCTKLPSLRVRLVTFQFVPYTLRTRRTPWCGSSHNAGVAGALAFRVPHGRRAQYALPEQRSGTNSSAWIRQAPSTRRHCA